MTAPPTSMIVVASKKLLPKRPHPRMHRCGRIGLYLFEAEWSNPKSFEMLQIALISLDML